MQAPQDRSSTCTEMLQAAAVVVVVLGDGFAEKRETCTVMS